MEISYLLTTLTIFRRMYYIKTEIDFLLICRKPNVQIFLFSFSPLVIWRILGSEYLPPIWQVQCQIQSYWRIPAPRSLHENGQPHWRPFFWKIDKGNYHHFFLKKASFRMKTFVWFVLLIPELRYQTNPELCKGLKMKLCIAIWQKKTIMPQ